MFLTTVVGGRPKDFDAPTSYRSRRFFAHRRIGVDRRRQSRGGEGPERIGALGR
jgi:hypothetical protein